MGDCLKTSGAGDMTKASLHYRSIQVKQMDCMQTLSRRTCSGKVWTMIRSACWQLLQSSPPDQDDLILNLLKADTGNLLLDQGTVVAFTKEGLPYKGFLFKPCSKNFPEKQSLWFIQCQSIQKRICIGLAAQGIQRTKSVCILNLKMCWYLSSII